MKVRSPVLLHLCGSKEEKSMTHRTACQASNAVNKKVASKKKTFCAAPPIFSWTKRKVNIEPLWVCSRYSITFVRSGHSTLIGERGESSRHDISYFKCDIHKSPRCPRWECYCVSTYSAKTSTADKRQIQRGPCEKSLWKVIMINYITTLQWHF